ncbi:alpha/beta fold hydrolase [Fictibacillus gelatini]|uniref:alpha/beta fold hydrolase n=1 Tax=Fictibacillus gelatini TaxID=225985 RepID=UPI00042110DF|nr:alpha/beta hydrolase [Fictibacillus gelatini]
MILHTNHFGNGRPLIFLHTGLQTGMTDFIEQRNYFQDYFEVIMPDLRDHGKSKGNKELPTIHAYFRQSIEDLKETVDHLNIEQCHFAGCSSGAIIAFLFANHYPHYVRTLTLSGIVPDKPEDWDKLHEEQVMSQRILLEQDEMNHYFSNLHKDCPWRKLIEFTFDSNWYPFDEMKKVQSLTMPVLFIVGEQLQHEVEGVLTYKKLLPHANIAILPFAGHLVHDEQPDLYTHVLHQFLKSV